MKKILVGLGASAIVATALMAAGAIPVFAKHGRVLGAAIAACNRTARDARRAARDDWKTKIDKIKADRRACREAATTGLDRKACNKTARDAKKAADKALRDKFREINKTRRDCIRSAQNS